MTKGWNKATRSQKKKEKHKAQTVDCNVKKQWKSLRKFYVPGESRQVAESSFGDRSNTESNHDTVLANTSFFKSLYACMLVVLYRRVFVIPFLIVGVEIAARYFLVTLSWLGWFACLGHDATPADALRPFTG